MMAKLANVLANFNEAEIPIEQNTGTIYSSGIQKTFELRAAKFQGLAWLMIGPK